MIDTKILYPPIIDETYSCISNTIPIDFVHTVNVDTDRIIVRLQVWNKDENKWESNIALKDVSNNSIILQDGKIRVQTMTIAKDQVISDPQQWLEDSNNKQYHSVWSDTIEKIIINGTNLQIEVDNLMQNPQQSEYYFTDEGNNLLYKFNKDKSVLRITGMKNHAGGAPLFIYNSNLSLIGGHTYELNIKNNSATKKAGVALVYNDGESQVKQTYGAEWNTPAIFTVNSNVNNASLYFLTQNTGEENIDEILTDFSLTDISSAFASIKLKSTINKVTDFLYQKVSVYSETEKRYLIEPGTMFYTEEIEISNAVPFEDVKQNNKITISVEYVTESGFSLADIMTFAIRRDDNVGSETINSLSIDKDNLIIEASENSSISRKNINTNIVEVVSLNSSSEFIDKTAEIGVLYEYYTTTTDDTGMHTNKSNIVCIDYDHMVLCTKDKSLRIQYDPRVSGLKRNNTDKLTPTLGARYPKVMRNGVQDYKSFTINGLITLGLDDEGNEDFISDAIKNRYKAANLDPKALEFALEKNFRDNVLEFLHSPDVKLFKSAPEGNIFVYLTNISLTPKEELGRMIYSFSALATEVAEANSASYQKYFS